MIGLNHLLKDWQGSAKRPSRLPGKAGQALPNALECQAGRLSQAWIGDRLDAGHEPRQIFHGAIMDEALNVGEAVRRCDAESKRHGPIQRTALRSRHKCAPGMMGAQRA